MMTNPNQEYEKNFHTDLGDELLQLLQANRKRSRREVQRLIQLLLWCRSIWPGSPFRNIYREWLGRYLSESYARKLWKMGGIQ